MPTTIRCIQCDAEAPNRTHPKQKKFCSRLCKERYRWESPTGSKRRYHNEHRAEADARFTAWRKAHPDIARADRTRRQAIKRGASGPSITVSGLLERDGEWCSLCGLPLNGDITVDHLKPISLGGKHERYNLQLAHFSCNRSKHNTPFIQWALSK